MDLENVLERQDILMEQIWHLFIHSMINTIVIIIIIFALIIYKPSPYLSILPVQRMPCTIFK